MIWIHHIPFSPSFNAFPFFLLLIVSQLFESWSKRWLSCFFFLVRSLNTFLCESLVIFLLRLSPSSLGSVQDQPLRNRFEGGWRHLVDLTGQLRSDWCTEITGTGSSGHTGSVGTANFDCTVWKVYILKKIKEYSIWYLVRQRLYFIIIHLSSAPLFSPLFHIPCLCLFAARSSHPSLPSPSSLHDLLASGLLVGIVPSEFCIPSLSS